MHKYSKCMQLKQESLAEIKFVKQWFISFSKSYLHTFYSKK